MTLAKWALSSRSHCGGQRRPQVMVRAERGHGSGERGQEDPDGVHSGAPTVFNLSWLLAVVMHV